jgi:t-SNARE complex subunit (syntaxin)
MQQTMQGRVDNSALIATRDADMQNIEKELTEVNGIMHDLNTLAQSQSACISETDAITNNTVENVRKGVDQIKKAEKKQKMQTCSLL